MAKHLGWLLLAFLAHAPTSLSATTIVGTVVAQGKSGAEQTAGDGNYASRKFKFIDKINYAEIHDFIV